jgi:hypothetical protein
MRKGWKILLLPPNYDIIEVIIGIVVVEVDKHKILVQEEIFILVHIHSLHNVMYVDKL